MLLRSRLLCRLSSVAQGTLAEPFPRVAPVRTLHANTLTNRLKLHPILPVYPSLTTVRFAVWNTDGINQDEVESRVIMVCKAFDKITADKVTLTSHFINDLGLDSLDHVEVIMAIEDEFGFEIPDEEAEKLITPEHIVKFVMDRED